MANDGNNAQAFKFSLFDDVGRDPAYHREYGTSSYNDINLSANAPAVAVRAVLDQWFSRIPVDKQRDIRGRFRGDDRQHSGALLELLMHELLVRRCAGVTIDPHIGGKTPDFLASYHGTEFVVECTVAQESDKQFGALGQERDVLDIVERVSRGPYGLFLVSQRTGSSTVPRKHLTTFLEEKLQDLNGGAPPGEDKVGTFLPDVIEWTWNDWSLTFRPIIMGSRPGDRTVVGRQKGPYIAEDASIIERSLEKKAEAYTHLGRPYLVVATQREGKGNEEDLFDAVLGKTVVYFSKELNLAETGHACDGFFGSPSAPRNRHVSGVLFKRSLRSAWQIQNNWNRPVGGAYGLVFTDWTLVHHPEASHSLPIGMFPFATEYVWEAGGEKPAVATRTVNDLLGLPDPWPE